MDQRQPISAVDLLKSPAKRFQQRFFRSRTGQLIEDMSNQVSQDFGIGFGAKLMFLSEKLVSERLEIFNHSIMDQSELSGLIHVGVSVFVRNRAMGRPASMPQPQRTPRRFFFYRLSPPPQPTPAFPDLHLPICHPSKTTRSESARLQGAYAHH